MKKSRRNKKYKNNKNRKNNNADDNMNFDFNFIQETPRYISDEKNEEKEDNAAPLLKNYKKPEEKNIGKEDLGPALDMEAQSFNKYIDSFKRKHKGKIAIPINNFDYGYNTKKSKNRIIYFMRKIYKKQLLLNAKHKDCFILLEIKTELLKMISKQFYADDEENQRLYISIYNFENKFNDEQFIIGRYIIILEPFYKQYLDGKIGIRVDDPNDVIVFKDKDEAKKYISKELGDINKYIEIGDRSFLQKDYCDAIDLYSAGLRLNDNDENKRFILFKKIIDCCIKINANFLGLDYCEKYLSLYNNTNAEIIIFKINILLNLEKFDEAQKFLVEKKEYIPIEEYKKNLINIKKHLDNKRGIFKLEDIKGGDISNYLNQKLKIDLDQTTTGNKIVAKENISKGELLIAEKAFNLLTMEEYIKGLKEYYETVDYKRYKTYYFDKMAEFMVEPESFVYENLRAQKMLSEKDFEKLLDLDDYDNWNIKYTEREKKYPDKQTPNLVNIANINSIKIYSSIFSCEPHGYGYGLWYYPSFINHSCNPNTLEFGIKDIYFLYAQKDIKMNEEITRRYCPYGLDIHRRTENYAGYGFLCKCEVCQHQQKFMLQINNERYNSLKKELNNLFEENISDKNIYKSINNLENLISTNWLEYNIYDLITYYFRAGYLLLNRKIYLKECEKFLNKAYILLEGKNFHYECIILHYLYIFYYENGDKEKMKNIEEKIENKLKEFFGNTFLKSKLLDVYEERKNIKLVDELNKKVEYFEDIEKKKNKCCKITFIQFASFLLFILGVAVAIKISK